MEEKLVNRVAESGLITINLENYFPESTIAVFDLKDYLFHGLILKEKDFRDALKQIEWRDYAGKMVLIICSGDAIIPMWAYMLVSQYLAPYATDVFTGDEDSFLRHYYHQILSTLDLKPYEGQRIIIKGCGSKPVPSEAYARITQLLQPVAQSIMFGEPCSTVPVFKKSKIM